MYSNILVINLMHIGDLLLITPILRTLRTNYPDAHITLLADQKLDNLMKNNRNLNELILIQKKGYHNKLGNYLRLIGDIRRRRFDLVINFQANERASIIAAFSGGKKIIGYSSWGLGMFYDFVIDNRNKLKHQVQAHFDVLREALGISRIDDRGLEMWLDEESELEANRLWLEKFPDPGMPVIGLNIGASWPTKRWPKEFFAQLADKLLAMGYGVAFFGGPMDKDIVESCIELMKDKDQGLLGVFTGKVNLLTLAALLKKCTVLVTNDSGPMHIAVAMKTPLVAIFGPSPVIGFSPYDESSIVLESVTPCHPCGEHYCREHKLECMYSISVDRVLEKTLTLAKKRGLIGN